MLRFRRRRKR